MPATVTIRRYTGTAGSPVKNNVTSSTVMFVTEDIQYTAGTEYPIPIPAAGSNLSYWVAFSLSVDTAPSTSVSAVKAYLDGVSGLPTGVTLAGNTATTYVQSTGTPGTTALTLNTTNYSTLAGATADAFTWTAGSPKSVAGTITTTGETDLLVLQMAVASTATTSGDTAGETLSFVFDET